MSTSRKIKNVIKNYNDSQRKVRDATSNDPWGPASSTMSEIADLTYNVVAFTDIMDMIWRRINDKGKNWRHVYKALVLLDYIIKTGSERVAQQCKEKIVDINTLKDFRFYDTNNQDVGRNVREKSKQIVELLKNEERLKSERVVALKAKERFAQANQGIGSNTKADTLSSTGSTSTPTPTPGPVSSSTPPPTRNLTSEIEQARPQTSNEEELQLQLALAMSKEEAEQERQQKKNERIRFEMAINESLDEGSGSLDPTQQLASDPWAATSVVAAAAPAPHQPPQNDPWAALAAPPPLQAPAPTADPWAPTPPTVQPAADPWGSPVPIPAAIPAAVPAAVPQALPQNDPWAVSQPKDPDSEFDLLRSTTTTALPPAQPSSNGNLFGGAPPMAFLGHPGEEAFDMIGMTNTLEPQKAYAKKPEDFLGENSSLVNLDALVGPPKPSQLMPQAPNPFLSAGMSGGVSASQSNPFQQQRQPAPTINQMRAEPMMNMSQPAGMYGAEGGGFPGAPTMGGSSLPPPLIPMSSSPLANQMQTQQANNPFLL